MSQIEYAWYSEDNLPKLIKINNNDINRFHPTQKPIQLYKWLLTNYAKPNDKILDTHLGSGSIAIACYDLGFDLTACELDTDYYNAAMKRINDHKKQLKLI
jgi:site-specific DNA-methyltransferase (adenine-specific)